MAIYREDFAEIDLISNSIHRSFMARTIGEGDQTANRIGVIVKNNGNDYNLDGCNCTGYFIRSDGGTVIISGTASGNKAYVDIPQACYIYEGQFALAIKITSGSSVMTARIVDGVVANTSTGTLIDPGTIIPTIEDLLEAIEAAVESIPADYSTLSGIAYETGADAVQLMRTKSILTLTGYVDPNGNDYGNNNFVKSQYIPVRKGDSFEYKNFWGNSGNVGLVVFYDKTFTKTSAVTSTGELQSGTVTAADDGYVRFSTLASYISTQGSSIRPVNEVQERINNNTSFLLPMMNEENIFTIDGHYVTQSGDDALNSNYFSSPMIYVRQGDQFVYMSLWGNNGVVSVLAFYNLDRTFISGSSVIATGIWQSGTFTAPSDGYIRFSMPKSYYNEGKTRIRISELRGITGYFKNSIYEHTIIKTRGIVADTLGDSITNQSYMAEADKWQTWLKTMLALSTIYNHGVDMSTVADLPNRNGMCTDDRINALSSSAKLIIVMGGMNDWASNVPIGDRTFENETTSTFFGACNVLFKKLTQKYINARIVAFGTTFGYLKDREVFTDPTGYRNNQGLISLDYSLAMMEAAQMYGIEHYDMGGNWGVNTINKTMYLRSENDGNTFIHPNEYGSYRMAQYMAKMIGAD